jgi:DNA-binding NarL/FixJ family response regulator
MHWMAIDATTHRSNVLLIPSTECGWADVRQQIADLTCDTQVREAVSLRHARRLAAECAPDLVLAAGRVAGESSVPFLRQLHRDVCPHSRILVIGMTINPRDFVDFEEVNLAGYLLWSDLTTATLPHVLTVVLESEFIVVSPPVAQGFLDALQSAANTRPLTEVERHVLRRLAEGCTDREIATLESVSERTVERIVAKFEAELAVGSRFALGFELGRRGLLDRE